MKRHWLQAIAVLSMFALTASAQQTTPNAGDAARGEASKAKAGPPGVEEHLKVLSEKLALSSDQQEKARPIIQEMHDATEKVMQDRSLTREERHARVRPIREKADQKLRVLLTDDQKKKLDELERALHAQMHGDASNPTPAPHAHGA